MRSRLAREREILRRVRRAGRGAYQNGRAVAKQQGRGERMTSVGVIGLGLIGTALAHRLIATGDAPLVFDVKREAVEGAVAVGAIATDSSAELAERCDVVLVCVQTDDQCIAAVRGEGGRLKAPGPAPASPCSRRCRRRR